jgi:hypothetical protein
LHAAAVALPEQMKLAETKCAVSAVNCMAAAIASVTQQTTLFARVANSQTTLAWRWTIFR